MADCTAAHGMRFHKGNKIEDKSFDLSSVVDYTGKISNLLEDLRKVEKFSQYIENQASENMTEMEGSEIKQ